MRPITIIIAIMACLIAMGSETAGAASPSRRDATPLDATASRVPYSTGDSYQLPGGCRSVLVADFNRDHMNDLVTSTGTGGQLWINDGSGRLAPGDLGIPASELRSADMDGDGLADLVSSTDVYRGRGDGTFEPGVSYRSGGACGLAIGDLDNDGRTDIAIADCDAGNIRIFVARDSGFYALLLRSTVPNPTQLLIADFDGDAIRDLAVVGSEGDSGLIAVRLGLGWAMFRDPITRTIGGHSAGAEVGDLDSDGSPDLAISSWSERVTIAWNDGHGHFDARTVLNLRNQAYLDASPALADIDGDGRIDIASAGNYRESNRVQLFMNLGSRRFDSSLAYYIGSRKDLGYLERLAMADLDGHGGPEIIAIASHHPGAMGEMQVLHHLGGRAFAGAADYAVGKELLRLEAVDNGTGRQDLVAHGTEHTWRMRSRGDGTFDPPVEVVAGMESARGQHAASFLGPNGISDSLAVIADFDRDGLDDRAVVVRDPGFTTPESLTVVHGNLDGSMSVVEAHGLAPLIECCRFHATQLFAANFNGDAFPDLMVVEELGNSWAQVSILLNRRDGRFTDAALYRVRSEDPVIQVTDLNADGIDDFIATPCVGDWLLVEINPGDGTFQSDDYPFNSIDAAYFGVQDYPLPVIGDFNGDGRPDIAFSYNRYEDELQAGVGVLLNLTPQHSTPVLFSLVQAALEGNHIHVVWQSGAPALATLTVERRIGDGPWVAVGASAMNGEGYFDYVDADLRPGQRHRYRLAEAGGASHSSEASVDVPGLGVGAGLELAVQSIRPNPVRREATLSFSLASDDPARVEVLEVGGRRVMTVPIASATRGRHALVLPAGGTLSPGLYWIRLSQGARSATARMVVIQ